MSKAEFANPTIRRRARPAICIDFDGTLVDYSEGYRGPGVYGSILEGAREGVRALAERFEVIVLTARGVDEHARILAHLRAHGIPVAEVTNVKLPAAFYIDDRAVRFSDWRSVLAEVEGHVEIAGVPDDATVNPGRG